MDVVVNNGFISFECKRTEWGSVAWQQILNQFHVAMENDGMVSQGKSGETLVFGFEYTEDELFDPFVCQYFWLPPMTSSLGPPLSKDYTVTDKAVNAAKGQTHGFVCTAWPAFEPPKGMDRLIQIEARIDCFTRHAVFAQRSATFFDMMKVVLRACSHKYNVLQPKPISYKMSVSYTHLTLPTKRIV